MVKIFLDANVFIDLIEKRRKIALDNLRSHHVMISPLSVHILAYLYKYKIPQNKLLKSLEQIMMIPFTENITGKALLGPTEDFEDNVQLHSAAQEECDVFLTNDRDLLSMRFFGKTQIMNKLLDNQLS